MNNYLQTFAKENIKHIYSTDCLADEDINFLKAKEKDLQDNFEKKQIFRTETEMVISVLQDIKFPDPAAKYWQSVRELDVMFNNLASDIFNYRKNDVEIRKKQRQIDIEEDDLEKELQLIELEELSFKKKQIQLVAKDRMREIKAWQKIKENLVKQDDFDITDINKSQLKSLAIRCLKEVDTIKNTKAHLGSAEARNLLGQSITLMKECEKEGILNEVVTKALPNEQEETMKLLGFTSKSK